ncbi:MULTISPECIES: TetR family transcriptional regulator [unclassified Paenibacillus]|uniref:TetR/AcrR family transcriptional regulator n=1 Tax=unclassified Paenibacillus TaxID=185978 RepID=UPI0009F8A586|nr:MULTISPECIES: TetR family transcriptional regulator [unclassified Paenibacillus]ASS69505.1 TetR family transcriptional regulator [Paenibacillus sp. RUD330]
MEIALRRFAKDGYHVTKISDIVAEAGVAQGTFYWHFKSKEAIALEIVLDGRRQLLEVIAQGYRRETGTVQDMVQVSEALLARLFLFAESNRDLMEMLLGGIGAIEPIRQEIAETRAAMERAFLQNIRRAIELGMLPAEIDAEVRAALIMSLIEGVIARWLFGLNAPGSGISSKTAEQLASETARFEFFGLLGI